MQTQNELLNLENPVSIARIPFKGNIKLSECQIPAVEIPERFTRSSFCLFPKLDLIQFSSSESDYLLMEGIKDEKFIKTAIAGLCEAVKNAYEHGNKRNPEKKIIFARAISQDKIEFLVGDEGGIIDANFFPYILRLRQENWIKRNYAEIPNFYEFRNDMFAPVGFSGIGAKTMHLCYNKVDYYQNKEGGLLVHLMKEKKS